MDESASLYTILGKDKDFAFLAFLYIDPFPRPGKYIHFGRYALQPVSQPSFQLSIQILTHRSRVIISIHKTCNTPSPPASHEELERMDLSVLWNKMVTETTGLEGLELETGRWDWGHRFASLRLMAAG
jgi:hypothetical protein